MANYFLENKRVIWALLVLLFVGVFLRVIHQSDYNFYPDSYQNLIVAQNIENYGSASGTLGDEGGFYPPFLEWTRSGYPILIAATDGLFGNDKQAAAQAINLILSAASILLAYVVVTKISSSRIAGFSASLLLAISFNHIVWGGFVLTESVGVFCLLLLLNALAFSVPKPTDYLQWRDILTGLIFTLAIFTRYEYVVLALPIVYLIFALSPHPWKYLLNFSAGTLLTSGILIYWLAPWPYSSSFLWSIITGRWWVIAVGLFLAGIFFVRGQTTKYLAYLGFGSMLLLALLAATGMFKVFESNLGGLVDFVKLDFAIFLLSVAGMFVLFIKKNYIYAVFISMSVLLLAFTYYQINPLMQRYWTHIIPVLLIPAGYMIQQLFAIAEQRKWIYATPVIIGLLQAYVSFYGLTDWDGGIWFKPGYEEVSAKQLDNLINPDSLLIVSYPEPYYYFTGNATYSINDNYPYVYIDDSLNEKQAYIVLDMGMRDYFPQFTSFVQSNMLTHKIDEYMTGSAYRRQSMIVPETQPVEIYSINLGELKNLIADDSIDP